jgi:hypothetical protein
VPQLFLHLKRKVASLCEQAVQDRDFLWKGMENWETATYGPSLISFSALNLFLGPAESAS